MAQGRSDESVAIDVESLVSSLKVEFGNARLNTRPSYCIFKTPSLFSRHRENVFLPNYFSIGPIHHGKGNLVATEEIKVKYLKDLLSRVVDQRHKGTMLSQQVKEMEKQKILTDCFYAIKSIEFEAQACYASECEVKLGDEFVKMLVLDGCFMIELFRRDAQEVRIELDDPIFSMSCMLQFLHHDLILLENQIPWFVLQTLFDKTKLPFETKSLIELALLFFETTETIFRNLIVYEQCLPNCEPIFTSYAMILSNLIDTTDDTQILCKKGIIDSWVSAEEATKFFDKLYYNTYVKEFYYFNLCDDLNNYCNQRWPRWRAAYVHNYLSKSWIVVVVAAQLYAVSMFGLTFLQTFFTVFK
ncbi:hypothetical protein COLO4_17161 [Corchorus olitorius]|uniref:Uncharacterized protein n=1 Tax=Corchorus olitorius TaxID=93759 RepID=A0A1R3JDW5_9ROSI|nr:hypothetical protein COLO4_17161 [Corchorus olitorius]